MFGAALLGLTLWVVSRHWRTDLVEARRRLRLGFVGLNGAYLLLLIFSREVLFPGAAWLATWEYLPPALLLFLINLSLLEYRGGLLFQPVEKAPRPEAPAVNVDPGLLARLETHMQAESAWRQMGLTLGEHVARCPHRIDNGRIRVVPERVFDETQAQRFGGMAVAHMNSVGAKSMAVAIDSSVNGSGSGMSSTGRDSCSACMNCRICSRP